MLEINKVYCEDCLVTMGKMPDGFIDLTVASPPYDDIRDYKGFKFYFKHIARRLFRVTKFRGVVVWIVNDGTINGSESGTSFKQALFFIECGFRLHDTMIWEKESFRCPANGRYHQTFEYMFIFSKGKPITFNPIKDRRNIHNGTAIHGTQRLKDGSTRQCNNNGQILGKLGMRHNVWKITSERQKIDHPAPFAEQIAADHIYSWSNKGDLVYDCFAGSGTTLKMAHEQGRNWIGSEISPEYCEIIQKRLAPYLQQQKLFT